HGRRRPRAREGADRVLQGADLRDQVSALGGLHGRAPAPSDRQALQAPAQGPLLGQSRKSDRLMIGRSANPYPTGEGHRPLPAGTTCEPLQLVTPDAAVAHGWLYARGGERNVACLMHPRANFSRHYAVPALLEAGFAVLCENSRWLNNDATLIH